MGTGFRSFVLTTIVSFTFILVGSFVGIDKAVALTQVEQAHVNVLEKLRPQEAKRLKKELDDISASKKTRKQKQAARHKAFRKSLQRADTALKVAKKFGTAKQQKDARRVGAILTSFSLTTLFGVPATNDSVKKEIARMKLAEKKRKEEEKKKQADSSNGLNSSFTDTPFTITMGGQAGRMKRSSVSFLRTELGGNILYPNFGEVKRKDNISGINFTAQLNLDERPIMGKQVGLSPFFSVNHNYTENQVYFPNLSAMGAQLGVLGVEGPAGPLGGGLITGAGFGDVTNGRYMEYYRESLLFIGVNGQVDLEDMFGNNNRPSLSVHGAFMYGNTHERSYYGGTTNAGTLNFQYNNLIKSDRYGAEVGLKYKIPINDDFGVFANGAVRAIHNDASGYTMLNSDLNGVPFAQEYKMLSRKKFDVGGKVGAGVFASAGPLTGYAGVEAEMWKIPVLQVTGSEPARIVFKKRTSVMFKLSLRYKF